MPNNNMLALLLALSLAFTGCTAVHAPVMPRPDDRILDYYKPALTDSANEFGFDLYRKLLEEGENILLSPTSIAMALSMAYNGADGETREAMARAMKVEGIDLEQLNGNNLALLYFLRTADEKVALNIANSLWMREGFSIKPDFIKEMEGSYLAAARELDFNDPQAARTINGWVEEKTQGLIPTIVEDPINPLTIMFLINAIYFKGEWTRSFKPELTSHHTFFNFDSSEKSVPMMYQTGSFDYYETREFQAIRLPYGEEERLAMYVFLPREENRLEAFHQELTGEKWNSWLSCFEKRQGTLLLPRFTLEYEASLRDALKALGMEIAFDPARSDFSRMVPEDFRDDVHISDVKHKTYIDVDEKGTEAAAVTSVEVSVTSMPMYDFTMEVNRPFFYAIADEETGAVLFLGSLQSLR